MCPTGNAHPVGLKLVRPTGSGGNFSILRKAKATWNSLADRRRRRRRLYSDARLGLQQSPPVREREEGAEDLSGWNEE